MQRIAWILAPCASLLADPALLLDASGAAPAASAARDIRVHEPLLAFDVIGPTFVGLFDDSPGVYNEGALKRLSQSQGEAAIIHLSPALTRQLGKDLPLTGTLTLCDATESGADIAFKALKLFRGKADAVQHTVNWWNDDSPYGDIKQVLDDFIATHLP